MGRKNNGGLTKKDRMAQKREEQRISRERKERERTEEPVENAEELTDGEIRTRCDDVVRKFERAVKDMETYMKRFTIGGETYLYWKPAGPMRGVTGHRDYPYGELLGAFNMYGLFEEETLKDCLNWELRGHNSYELDPPLQQHIRAVRTAITTLKRAFIRADARYFERARLAKRRAEQEQKQKQNAFIYGLFAGIDKNVHESDWSGALNMGSDDPEERKAARATSVTGEPLPLPELLPEDQRKIDNHACEYLQRLSPGVIMGAGTDDWPAYTRCYHWTPDADSPGGYRSTRCDCKCNEDRSVWELSDRAQELYDNGDFVVDDRIRILQQADIKIMKTLPEFAGQDDPNYPNRYSPWGSQLNAFAARKDSGSE
jgi:hypothetical protein